MKQFKTLGTTETQEVPHMSQPHLVTTEITPMEGAKRLLAQQVSIKDQAHAVLDDFAARLAALIAEANELSKVDGVFSKPVSENLGKFVSFGSSSLQVFTQAGESHKTQQQGAKKVAMTEAQAA